MTRLGKVATALLVLSLVAAGVVVGSFAGVTPGSLGVTTVFTSVGSTYTYTLPDPPGAPTLLSARPTQKGIELEWNAPTDGPPPDLYSIHRRIAGGDDSPFFVEAPTRTFVDTAAALGTTYYYTISAFYQGSEGPRSNELSATRPAPVQPGAPALTEATPGVGQVTLRWTAPTDNGGAQITAYNVYRATATGAEQPLATVGNVSTYKDTTVANATRYFYEVSAVNSAGEGPLSNELDATPITSLFQPYQALPTGSRPQAIAIGDVTGDGRNDVVMTTSFNNDAANDHRLFVFAQAPDGSLSAPVGRPLEPAGGFVSSDAVAVGDITGDGRGDVVLALSGHGVEVFPQLPSGVLGTPTITSQPDVTRLRLGQFDSDGRLDVLALGPNTPLSVLYNDGAGGLRAPVSVPCAAGRGHRGDGHDERRPRRRRLPGQRRQRRRDPTARRRRVSRRQRSIPARPIRGASSASASAT